jgi:TPP-dependent pyruvate/acetoin dehydrogenase alpha subunit
MPVARVDGNDVLVVEDAVQAAVDRARGGGGPSFIDAVTYRMSGHHEGDPQGYRDIGELEAWSACDPLERASALLTDAGCGRVVTETLRAAADEMDAAVAGAKLAPYPDVSTLLDHVDS